MKESGPFFEKCLDATRHISADAAILGQSLTFHRQMGAFAGLMAIAVILFSFPVRFHAALPRLLLLPVAIGVVTSVLLPGVWACWEWKRQWFPKVLELTLTAIWIATVWALSWLLAQVAARSPFAMADSMFARMDSHIIQTVSIVRWINGYPLLRTVFTLAYASLDPLVVLAFIAPILCGRFADSRRLLLAITVSFFPTIGLFALFPAVGPWIIEGFQPSATQAPVGPYLIALKSGITPSGAELSGIVAFPSFHTILALLAGASLSKIRRLRWIAGAVAVGVCIGTVTTGWHYVVDVMAGSLVATVSWFTASALSSSHSAQTDNVAGSARMVQLDVERA